MKTAARASRPYRQTARAIAAHQTGRRILSSFRDAITLHWFDDVRLEDIAHEAGVTVQTVIRRFGGKEGLIEAVTLDIESEVIRRRDTPAGDVDAAISALAEDYEINGDITIRMLAQETRHPAILKLTDVGRAGHRTWIEKTFAPNLSTRKGRERDESIDALVAATDVYLWQLLRRSLGRSPQQYQALVLRNVRSIIADGYFSEGV